MRNGTMSVASAEHKTAAAHGAAMIALNESENQLLRQYVQMRRTLIKEDQRTAEEKLCVCVRNWCQAGESVDLTGSLRSVCLGDVRPTVFATLITERV